MTSAHPVADRRAVLLDRARPASRERARRPGRTRRDPRRGTPARRRRRADLRRADRGLVGHGRRVGPLRHRRRGRVLVRPGEAAGRPAARRRATTCYVFARGLLRHQLTRLYFPDEPEANAADPVLSAPARGRSGDARRRAGGRRPTLRHPHARRPANRVLRALTTFDAIFVPAPLRDAVSDAAWVDAMVEVERALATRRVPAGVIRGRGRALIAERAAATALYDACRPGRGGTRGREPGRAARPCAAKPARQTTSQRYVHFGATSQDIVDSAAMLVARRALALIDEELSRGRSSSAPGLRAEPPRHADGRPDAAAAGCADDVRVQGGRLARRGARRADAGSRGLAGALPAQLGGAAGTLAALGDDALEVLRLFAAELGLAEPTLPVAHGPRWSSPSSALPSPTRRAQPRKIGVDIALLAQTEVGEVAEAEPGGSSAMPQKRNPVGAVLAGACARHVRGHASMLAESVVGRARARDRCLARGVGRALGRARAATGGAAAAIRRSLDGLEVDVGPDAREPRPDRRRHRLRAARVSAAGRAARDRPGRLSRLSGRFVDRALEQTGHDPAAAYRRRTCCCPGRRLLEPDRDGARGLGAAGSRL